MFDQEIKEIMDLTLRVNNETEHAVFFYYSGHVEILRVIVAESKINYDNDLYSVDTYVTPRTFIDKDEIQSNLYKIIHELKAFLEVTENV